MHTSRPLTDAEHAGVSTTWPSTAEIVPFPAPNGAHAPLGLNGATHTTVPPTVGDNKPTFQDNADAVVRIGTIITSFKRIGPAIRDRRCQRPHLLVLYAFMEKLNQGIGTAFPSRRAIAEQEGLRYEAVENALYELRRWGYIDWEKRAEPDLHKGKLLHYTLPVLTWTDQELTNAILALRASQRAEGPRPAEYTSQDVHAPGCTPPRVTKSTPQGVTRNLLKRELEEKGADAPVAEATEFDRFWAVFPPGRKVDKGDVRDLFNAITTGKHKKRRASAATIISAVERYAATKLDPQYTPSPKTWLNGGRWEDDIPRSNSAADAGDDLDAQLEQRRRELRGKP